eukprot:762882-Hanusia_phi.AAC.3
MPCFWQDQAIAKDAKEKLRGMYGLMQMLQEETLINELKTGLDYFVSSSSSSFLVQLMAINVGITCSTTRPSSGSRWRMQLSLISAWATIPQTFIGLSLPSLLSFPFPFSSLFLLFPLSLLPLSLLSVSLPLAVLPPHSLFADPSLRCSTRWTHLSTRHTSAPLSPSSERCRSCWLASCFPSPSFSAASCVSVLLVSDILVLFVNVHVHVLVLICMQVAASSTEKEPTQEDADVAMVDTSALVMNVGAEIEK